MKLIVESGKRILAAFDLIEGAEVTLGASRRVECTVSGEPYLSRRHARLRPGASQLEVEQLPDAKNPIFFNGSAHDRFRMKPNEYFVIGATSFHFRAELAATINQQSESAPIRQFTLGSDELRARGGREDRMRLLDLMELPEVLRTKTRAEFYVYACGLLRLATGAQWVQVLTSSDGQHTILAEDATIDRATPKSISKALLDAAVSAAPRPVTYCWTHPVETNVQATAYEGVDWAISCAMPVPGELPVLLYLAGSADVPGGYTTLDTQSGARTFLRDTARLVGLVADMIGRAMALQKVEAWQTRMSRFFSKRLVSRILEADASETLSPKIAEASVMFFDIRGFSLMTEGKLERILEHEGALRKTLTAVTQCVYDHEGVVIRYMGDGMLACWNVPYPSANHVESACLAALEIVDRMAEVTDGWACGIGLGVGDVVAGSLGSDQVYAYDILGDVANKTARVEGITKIVGVPILATEEAAKRIAGGSFLTRRVARFRPVGMDLPVDLFTIDRRPTEEAEYQELRERLAVHERGLAAFEAGDWETAWKALHDIIQTDPAARFVYKLALQGKPPRDWEGVIELTGK